MNCHHGGHPTDAPETAFVIGQLGSGFILHLEQTSEGFVVFMEITSTKRWILMKTENPFLLVKYVLSLRPIICDNRDAVRKFLLENK